MENRQASYFSSGPTPRPDRNSAMRQPSASGTTSRLDQHSRAEHLSSRMDQPSRTDNLSAQPSRMNQHSRTGPPSAVPKSNQYDNGKLSPTPGRSKVTQTNDGDGQNSVKGKGKPHKTVSTKTAVTIIEEQNGKPNDKKPGAMVTENKKTKGIIEDKKTVIVQQ